MKIYSFGALVRLGFATRRAYVLVHPASCRRLKRGAEFWGLQPIPAEFV